MKLGGTYGTVIAYQKVGAQAGKKEEAKGKLNSGSKPSLWEKHLRTILGPYLLRDEFFRSREAMPFESSLGVNIDDQVFVVVYSLSPLLAPGPDGAGLVSVGVADSVAIPPGRHRGARSAGIGGSPDHAACASDSCYLTRRKAGSTGTLEKTQAVEKLILLKGTGWWVGSEGQIISVGFVRAEVRTLQKR
jgi:hypothetical protein